VGRSFQFLTGYNNLSIFRVSRIWSEGDLSNYTRLGSNNRGKEKSFVVLNSKVKYMYDGDVAKVAN